MGLYDKCIRAFGWSLRDLDETNLETLFDFVCYKDPDVTVINGKKYVRAKGVPKWL